ncbi:MAG: cytochrome ubiquinol oxidase subunit I [Fibrobacteres bacterium]|nr:cytochrome ubiquinol oxidase subunit I [Fibrobacterota bacterium]
MRMNLGAAVLAAVGLSLFAAPARAQEGQDLIKKSDCMACHQPEIKVVGPSFKDIAGRYGAADLPKLIAKVKQGGAGSWGEVPMAPHPALSDADLGKMIGWILSAHASGAKTASAPGPSAPASAASEASAAPASPGAPIPGTGPGSHPDYRRFPVIGSRVAIWIVAQLHLLFAAFVLAVPMFALLIEYIGYRTKDKRYDHLAHEFTKLLSTSFSFTASLGAMLTFLLLVLYPKVTNYLTNIFGWSFMPYAALFFAEAIFMYAYYYGWGKFHPRVHLLLGLCLNLVGICIIGLADAWLTFMNSPNGISEGGDLISRWQAVHNFTWMPINVHRLIANISFGGSIAAAYGAFKFMGAKTDEERAHYDWMGYVGNFVAISALLPLPFAGYWLGKEIYAYSQNLGMTLMGGAFSWLFIIQAVLIGTLFLSANYYLWLGMGRIEGAERFRGFIKWLLASVTLCFLVWATPHSLVATVEEARKMGGSHHPMLGVMGVMSAKNTAVNILILTTYISFLLYRRGNKKATVPWASKGNKAQFLIFAITALFVIALGVLGYFVEAKVRIRLSVPQVISVLFAMISVTIIDIFMFRKAETTGGIRWGKMPMRSQYALFLIAITFTWTMGLMGYARSGMRQHWHVYGVMKDTSPDAFTPTLGFATKIVSVTTLIFFCFISIVFWLSSLQGRKDWVPEGKTEGRIGS